MSTLNLTRAWQVLRLQALLHSRKLLAYFGPMLGILFIAAMSSQEDMVSEETSFFGQWYIAFILLGGFVFAASAVPENKTADGRQAFLTLPASDGEKWLGTYLYSGPAFFVVFTAVFFVLTWIVNGVLAIFQLGTFANFSLSDFGIWDGIGLYFLVVQPLGFLAAIVFNSAAAAKISGVVLMVSLALGVIGLLVFRIVFNEYFSAVFTLDRNGMNFGGNGFDLNLADYGWWLAVAFGIYLLAVAYFRFQEKEV